MYILQDIVFFFVFEKKKKSFYDFQSMSAQSSVTNTKVILAEGNHKNDRFKQEPCSAFNIESWADLKTAAPLAVPVECSPEVILLPLMLSVDPYFPINNDLITLFICGHIQGFFCPW